MTSATVEKIARELVHYRCGGEPDGNAPQVLLEECAAEARRILSLLAPEFRSAEMNGWNLAQVLEKRSECEADALRRWPDKE
jgi:hypothetical protein